MKLISFLYPYPIRNIEAPHLWLLYKLLENIPAQDIYCIGSSDYFKGTDYFKNKKRWECNWAKEGWKKSSEISQNYIIQPDIFDKLTAEKITPNRVWTSLISDPYPPLEDILDQHISAILEKEPINAIVTLCNCASLTAIAQKYNLPIIHIELGALRAPHYINTGYFDFSGVNGNTDAKDRFLKFQKEIIQQDQKRILPRKDLLEFVKSKASKNQKKQSFSKKIKRKMKAYFSKKPANEYKIGLPLQVEDDSNMLAYSNEFDNVELLSYAHKFYDKSDILVRKHPGGHANYKVENEDKSIFPYDFIRRCQSIVTINSSMGLESLLYNKPTWIMGENPFNFCASQSSNLSEYKAADDLDLRLNFAVFGYLVPFDLLLTSKYIEFRLGNPTEMDIYNKHYNYWESQ